MSDKGTLIQNIYELTNKEHFSIKSFEFDEMKFGNFCIELISSKQVSVRFIRDRGVVWCEVGRYGEWYFIEDLFRLIGTDFIADKVDVCQYLKYMSSLILNNISQISHVLDDETFDETRVKIKKIATERALRMFKLEQ